MDSPRGFHWRSIYGTSWHADRDALAYGTHEIARLLRKADGGWVALLRYPDGREVSRPCSSHEAGKAGCMTWAQRHRDVLVAWCEQKDREWQARRFGHR